MLGDLNAGVGVCGGPLAANNPNEHGKILLCYLHKWKYVSVHLHIIYVALHPHTLTLVKPMGPVALLIIFCVLNIKLLGLCSSCG